MKSASLPSLAVRLCALMALSTAQAQISSTWVGGSSGDWSDPSKWSPDTFYPDNGNGGNLFDVTINNVARVTLDRNITVHDLSMTGSSTIDGAHTLAVNGTTTLIGSYLEGGLTLDIGVGGTLNTSPAGSALAGALVNHGTANIGSTFGLASSSSISNSGVLNITAGGRVNSTVFNSSSFSNSGTVSLADSTTLDAYSYSNSGLLTTSGSGSAEVGTAAFQNSSTGIIDPANGALRFYQLENSGLLRGSGTIGTSAFKPRILSGGRISPGNGGAGTLAFDAGLIFDIGSILDFDLGSASDAIAVTGETVGTSLQAGGITLNVTGGEGFGAGLYTILTGDSFNQFDVTNFTIGSAPAGYDYAFDFTGSALQLKVAASPIPEPGTCALLAGLLALGAVVEIRRRRARPQPCG